jgi:Putative transposase
LRHKSLEVERHITWKATLYAKPPFGGPQQVLKYLARYTHRVAISNYRLLSFADNQVTFSYRDYAANNVTKTMTLETREFTRRFLLHVLPRGFVRIRHYGFLANRCRQEKLELCRRLIEQIGASTSPLSVGDGERDQTQVTLLEVGLCPVCRQGRMISLGIILTATDAPAEIRQVTFDSS